MFAHSRKFKYQSNETYLLRFQKLRQSFSYENKSIWNEWIELLKGFKIAQKKN